LLRPIVTSLLLLPAVSHAQRIDYTRESPAVAVLRAVMLYRIEHLGDRRARFDTCRAYAAMRRPADFLLSEYPYYHELLDRKDLAGCGARDERSADDRLPSIWIDSLVVADSVAMMRVTVIRGGDAEEWRHEEVYTVRRGFRPPSRPAGLWFVARVELSSGSQALMARRRRSP
jgi:hypothetical protein